MCCLLPDQSKPTLVSSRRVPPLSPLYDVLWVIPCAVSWSMGLSMEETMVVGVVWSHRMWSAMCTHLRNQPTMMWMRQKQHFPWLAVPLMRESPLVMLLLPTHWPSLSKNMWMGSVPEHVGDVGGVGGDDDVNTTTVSLDTVFYLAGGAA